MDTEFLNYLPIEQVLERTSISQLVTDQKIVSIPVTATLKEAIEILSKHKVLSAPLFDAQEEDPTKKYKGFIDMLDILSELVHIYAEEKTIEGHQLHLWCSNIEKLSHKGQEFSNKPIAQFINASKVNPFLSVKLNSKVPQLLFVFGKGVHRAAVVDEEDKIIGVVSQSSVTRFIAKYITHLPEKSAKATVEDIGFGAKPVITVNDHTRAIHAFHIMLTARVSSVGVVNMKGELISTISVSDLRGLAQENFASLLEPVLKFLKTHTYASSPIRAPVTVRRDSPLTEVILKLAGCSIHRVFVVDENGKPTGVISLTDIMKLLDLRVSIDQTQVYD